MKVHNQVLYNVFTFLVHPHYNYADWISEKLISEPSQGWYQMYQNPRAIWLIEQLLERGAVRDQDWIALSKNPAAFHLFEKYPEKVVWDSVIELPNVSSLLEKNIGNPKINWVRLHSLPSAIHFFRRHPELVDWSKVKGEEYEDFLKERLGHLKKAIQNDDVKTITKSEWWLLSKRSDFTSLLEKHIENLDWAALSRNPYSISLLKKHKNRIDWIELSLNPSALEIIEENLEKVSWKFLCLNPGATDLLSRNIHKIDWKLLSMNPGAFELLNANPNRIDLHNVVKMPYISKVVETHIPIIRRNIKILAYCEDVNILERCIRYVIREFHQDDNLFRTFSVIISSNKKAIHLLSKYPSIISPDVLAKTLVENNINVDCFDDYFKNLFITNKGFVSSSNWSGLFTNNERFFDFLREQKAFPYICKYKEIFTLDKVKTNKKIIDSLGKFKDILESKKILEFKEFKKF